jgi:hypothetical protein
VRALALSLFVAAMACLAFAYWGLRTPAGRRAFDEMAGIIPMAAGLAGVLFCVVALAIWLWRFFGKST